MYKKADFAPSKTPAPKVDRIKGSRTNPAGSAKSSSSASKISLSKSTISVLRKKLEDFRKKYPKKKNVSENDLKAVYRRGSGAYSSTHRPTISGGKPNSRAAWSYARVNAFLRKAAGLEVKKAYIQDDDLLKRGGQINPDEFALVVYHEKSGNWMVQQNKVYVWLYEDLDAAKKLQNDEYDWVMFPPTPSISMAFRRGYVPPLKQIWTKKYQKEHRGSDKLVGIVEGWYDEKNNKLYVLMMTTRKDYRRRGVNSYLITFLRQKFGLEKDQVIFDKPTDEGKLFEASGKYHLGGEILIGEIYSGLKVKDYLKKANYNDTSFFQYIKNSDKYTLKYVDINNIVANDSTLATFISDSGGSFTRNENESEWRNKYPIVIGDDEMEKNKVLDGYHRIAQAIENGENELLAFVKIQPYNTGIGYSKGGEMSKHLAPNGKPSNLTHEQWHLVRTPEFKAWFGDWENDPENASKVVDENGEPMVVYHATNRDFNEFRIVHTYLNKKTKRNWSIGSHFGTLSQAKQIADEFTMAGFFKPYFLNIRELQRVYDYQTWTYEDWEKNLIELGYIKGSNFSFSKIYKVIEDEKFEGFVYNNIYEGGGDSYVVLNPKSIKLADGTNTTFDGSNPDIRYEEGGNTQAMLKPTKTVEQIATEFAVPKYFVERQLQNGIRVELEHTNDKEVAEKIALHHLAETPEYYKKLSKMESQIEYKKGGKTGRVPSTDPSTWNAAYNVGDKVRIRVDFSNMDTDKIYTIKGYQDSLGDYNDGAGSGIQRPQNPSGRLYFLTDGGGSWEGKDLEPADQTATTKPAPKAADKKPDLISIVNEGNDYGFTTPTGEKTRLTYLQQVLVRTKGFKDFFGDWEAAAKAFLADGRNNFMEHYKNVSKVLDYNTLEPKVVYHGTRAEDEFFRFDVTKEKGMGRPYGYFAVNKQYSDRFTQFSQRSTRQTKPLLYTCFLNVRNPFMANGSDYWQKNRDEGGWLTTIIGSMTWERYKTIENNATTKPLADAIESQIGKYLQQAFGGEKKPFWINMAKDIEKDFKFFLMAYGYDGIIYGEEISTPYNPDDPSQYTEAVTIFDSKQVKLADGRNLNFNPLIDDIRYKRGGEVEEAKKDSDETHELHQRNPFGVMDKKAKLGMLINGKKYAEGGKIVHEDGSTNDGKKGGYFDGRSHADGGIKAINVDTGQLIEVEGEEVIITKGAVNDETKREFEGEMLTNREILSRINQSGGGVAFEDGGEVRGHVCGCSGKKYKYGGEMLEDFNIIRNMSKPIKFVDDMLQSPKRFADFLVEKMK